MDLKSFRQSINSDLEAALIDHLGQDSQDSLLASMRYSLENGGKRLRPSLLLATLASFGYDYHLGLAPACALEYIHTYSLIHDDLPAMDNDDYRRGQLTNHKKFDEATAILAGDALLTLAFEVLSQGQADIDPKLSLQLVQLLAQAAGKSGMVDGQIMDMASEEKQLKIEELKNLHAKKTGALIYFAIMAPALIMNLDTAAKDSLARYAKHFGIAYQIQNDLQEVMWTDEERGKKSHGDLDSDKNTYPSLLGKEGALDALDNERQACQAALDDLSSQSEDFDPELLSDFLNYLSMDYGKG
ncbi:MULTISPECIES: polyprenyl synthetase family protein [Aerococcus]|nr:MULTISPECIES: farnesyl diphosphate synthase [Aerococcus]KAA9234349.1 polyprenyl synthetase family protein [Aerococcus mictus]MBU5610375.1 polyprenyl synthetase family protein [Aerococcus urinae]MDK6291525.1 polyprenyl synthetase family protein [Aerococcus urinae]MDK6374563.1 polyprenyl synthetase family protein [Aerococcus urinae]MDK6421092.1 polyprenyl synthetase family protein [Aerococcus urinae]